MGIKRHLCVTSMQVEMCYNEHKGLRIVHIFATALATWPPYLYPSTSKIFKLYKLYGAIFVMFYMCMHWVVLIENFGVFFEHYGSLLSEIMRLMTYVLLGVSAIEGVLRSFYVADDFNTMVLLLKKFDAALCYVNKKQRTTNLQLYLEFCLINLLVFIMLCSVLVFWSNSNISALRFSLCFHYLYHTTAAFLFCIYADDIARKFGQLNGFLENSYNAQENLESKAVIRKIRYLYCSLSQAVRIYNKIFGWRIFFHFAVVLFGCVQLANMVAVLVLSYETAPYRSRNAMIETISLITTIIVRYFIISVSFCKNTKTLFVYFTYLCRF